MTGAAAGRRLLVAADAATELTEAVLVAHGASPPAARRVAEHLVDSSLCGVHSHGVIRVPEYVRLLHAGDVDGTHVPRVDASRFPLLEVRAGRAFGPVAAGVAVDAALDAVRRSAVAVVLLRDSAHTGRIGAYVERLALAGVPAVAFCSSPRSHEGEHLVAPFGGREGRLATNPIAYGVPLCGEPPIVADFSTSALAEGRVRWLRNTGHSLPPEALRDSDGNPTADPATLYAEPRGAIQPLGGEHGGHKGYALGLLVELLATLVPGDDALDTSRTGNNVALIAFAVDGDFAARARAHADWVRSSPPVPGVAAVQMPGERERRARERAQGVEVDAGTWEELAALARAVGAEVPVLQPVDKLHPGAA